MNSEAVRVRDVNSYLVEAELQHQSVGYELDVLLHQLAVHPDQLHGQSLGQKLLHTESRGEKPQVEDLRSDTEPRGGPTNLFDLHGVPDDGGDCFRRGLVQQVFEHQTGEVTVQTLKAANPVRPVRRRQPAREPCDYGLLLKAHLVSADQLVGEGQAGHQASLLQPEDGGERTGEEDPLHGRERHHALTWTTDSRNRPSVTK